MDIWVIGILNQLFIRDSYPEIKSSKKKKERKERKKRKENKLISDKTPHFVLDPLCTLHSCTPHFIFLNTGF